MVFVVTQVTHGVRTLKPWYGKNAVENCTIADIFSSISDEIEVNVQCFSLRALAGPSKQGCDIEVSADSNVCDVVSAIGCFLLLQIIQKDEVEANVVPTTSQTKRDAFSILMHSSKVLFVPDTCPPINEKVKLKNDIISWLIKNKLGWDHSVVGTLGKSFVSTLTNCLWTVDGHEKTLTERGHSVPSMFKHFQGYNKPELMNQKKMENMDRDCLMTASDSLFSLAGNSYMKMDRWRSVFENTLRFADALRSHADYLQKTCDMMIRHHKMTKTKEKEILKMMIGRKDIPPTYQARYKTLHEALLGMAYEEHVFVNDYTPLDHLRRHEYIAGIVSPVKSVLYTYSTGGEQLAFMWKVPVLVDLSEEALLNFNSDMKNRLIEHLPKYHTRAMRREFLNAFGSVTNARPVFLRETYHRLTGDQSVSDNSNQAAVDERVHLMLENEDPDLLVDLRVNNPSRPEKYEAFLNRCQIYINEHVETAVDDRRHDNIDNDVDVVTHLATALSARDMFDEVAKRFPEDTPIPSLQWLRLQFWPRKASTRAAGRYSGAIKIKYMVQSRQFRLNHRDCHYASALFKYQREFAVQFREYVTYASMDDKHVVKVGEPGYPVSAVERGKAALIQSGKKLVVADHDFTKFSLTPSVTLFINVPETTEGSFYSGKVFVGLKENSFEPSSPIRHMAELDQILHSQNENKPILLLYTDGGPDHRLTYVSVMMSLISMFIKRDFDFVCAVRTPPYNSWKNPVERIMSIINLGLQGIGLMREVTSFETILKGCSSLADIRKAAKTEIRLVEEVLNSVRPVKELIGQIVTRLKLKGIGFQSFQEATEQEIEDILEQLLKVDDTLAKEHKTKQSVKNNTKWNDFIQKHCKVRHYMFSIKKCNDGSCLVCLPPRLPQEVFEGIIHLPDPVPNGDRYKPFNEIYGQETTEVHRPSLNATETTHHGMPFNPSAQYAKNTNVVIKCGECKHWRCVYSKKKLSKTQESELNAILSCLEYTCGSTFKDLDCAETSIIKEVYVKENLTCCSPTELPYYSAKYEEICYYCGEENQESLTLEDENLPRCNECVANKKPGIQKRGHKFVRNKKK